jgi:cell division protein FtsL
MKRILKHPLLRNRYFLSAGGLLIWILLFHNLDAIFIFRMQRDLSQTRNQIEYYETRNAENKAALKELSSSPKHLEKFAREQYFMKRENEELFVIFESDD